SRAVTISSVLARNVTVASPSSRFPDPHEDGEATVTLRARTLLMVTALLVVAVLASAPVLTWTSRHALLLEAETQGRLLARLLAITARFASEVTNEVEGAIGEQMIVEATIAAHLVALAESAGVKPERINAHLRAISRDTVL